MLNSDLPKYTTEQKTAGDNRVMELLKELEKARKDRCSDAGKSQLTQNKNS